MGALCRKSGFLLGLTLFLAACGCGQPGGAPGGQQEDTVTEADFGEEWPFSVSEGTLGCDGSDGLGAVTFEAEGRVYGLNGTAKSKGLPEVRSHLAR